MNIANLLMRSARVFPGAPAIFHGDKEVCNYDGFARDALRIAGFFTQGMRLEAGDRVAIYTANTPDYLTVLYGAWSAGLTVVPVNARLHPQEVMYILENSGAKILFTSSELQEGVHSAVAAAGRQLKIVAFGSEEFSAATRAEALSVVCDRGPDDIAWLFYTSGTTGRPKGVMQTHRNLMVMALCYFADVDTATAADCTIYAAPMSHAAGFYSLPHVLAGARHIIPASGGFDPKEIVSLSILHKSASMFLAPTMVKRLIEYINATGADYSELKTIVYGGGPMYLEDIKTAIATIGDRFVQIYGQGECPLTITSLARGHLQDRENPSYEHRISSVGVAQSMVEVRIADDHGNTLPDGESGEVVVRGDSVMKGYWNNPDATAATIRNGWLYTGDMGVLDPDGFLTLKDRSKDVVISGGSNIYPREVEEVLLGHPGVKEVAVVGRLDPLWGEEVVAVVVRREGVSVTDKELDAHCLSQIARFKRPKVYLFIEELPKNNYGKVLKTELRKLIAEIN